MKTDKKSATARKSWFNFDLYIDGKTKIMSLKIGEKNRGFKFFFIKVNKNVFIIRSYLCNLQHVLALMHEDVLYLFEGDYPKLPISESPKGRAKFPSLLPMMSRTGSMVKRSEDLWDSVTFVIIRIAKRIFISPRDNEHYIDKPKYRNRGHIQMSKRLLSYFSQNTYHVIHFSK